jgi:hypothetical protein
MKCVWFVYLDDEPGPIDGGSRPCKRPVNLLRYTGRFYWPSPSTVPHLNSPIRNSIGARHVFAYLLSSRSQDAVEL